MKRRHFIQKLPLIPAVFHTHLSGGLIENLGHDILSDADNKQKPEWRNKQDGMHYRKLGRTNLMVSEIVMGGGPIRENNSHLVIKAIERGVNYIDTAPGYGQGAGEEAIGKLFKSSSFREKVFLTSKVSSFNTVRHNIFQDTFNSLSTSKQADIQAEVDYILQRDAILKPGYHFDYFRNQVREIKQSYLADLLIRDYSHLVDSKGIIIKTILDSVDETLKRTRAGYLDILMVPHGASSPESLKMPGIYEAYSQLKKEGKVRFLGVSSHNNPAGILNEVIINSHYDVAMLAYNLGTAGSLEREIINARNAGVGIIAMKAATFVVPKHDAFKPGPQWRIAKLNDLVKEDLKTPVKAYLWALQNEHISAVISDMVTEQAVNENTSITGIKIDLSQA